MANTTVGQEVGFTAGNRFAGREMVFAVGNRQSISNLRSATIISGLTPGMTYVFQARAVVQSAYTDWSDSVMQMAM